jgi:GAF domain-containing protein
LTTDEDALDLQVPPTEEASLSGRAERLRRALMGFGAFFAAARHDDPLPHLRDLACDLLFAEELHITVPAPIRNAPLQPGRLCSPIMIGRRAVGAIEATRSKPFDEDERILADVLGQIIGAVLDQSTIESQYRQYRTQVQANAETLDLLLDFSRQMAHGVPDPVRVGLHLATQVPQMVGGERASLLLTPFDQPNAPMLLLSSGIISSPERALDVRDRGLAGMVLRDRRPLIIDETDTDQRWFSLTAHEYDQPTRCAMAVPLIWGRRVLGALTVTTTQTHLFDTPQLHLLELIACHVSLAIYCTSLDAQLRHVGELIAETTAQIDAAIAVARRSLHQITATEHGGYSRPADIAELDCVSAALERIEEVSHTLQEQQRVLHSLTEGGATV